jgi:hypothetical protein
MHAGEKAWEKAAARLEESARAAVGRRAVTSYLRRLSEGGKSRGVELGLLMLREGGQRVAWREVIDFASCTVRDELRVQWAVDRSEYLRLLRTAGQCPERDERSWWAWVLGLEEGKSRRRLTEFVTAETATLRVSLTEEEWERAGHPEILESLSPEFRRVFGEEVAAMSEVDSGVVAAVCPLVEGLFSLRCNDKARSRVSWEAIPNCDFDASFGVPCSEEERRLAELQRRRGRLH